MWPPCGRALEVLLLQQLVLDQLNRLGYRMDLHACTCNRGKRGRIDMFDLHGDYIHLFGQLGDLPRSEATGMAALAASWGVDTGGIYTVSGTPMRCAASAIIWPSRPPPSTPTRAVHLADLLRHRAKQKR